MKKLLLIIAVAAVAGWLGYEYWQQQPRQVVSRYIESVASGSPDDSLFDGNVNDDAVAPYRPISHEIRIVREYDIGIEALSPRDEVVAVIEFESQAGGLVERVVTFVVGPNGIQSIRRR